MNTRQETTGWGRWSTGNCPRNWNLTILPNGISTNRNPSLGVWDTNRLLNTGQKTRPSDNWQKRENQTNSWLCRPGRQQNENQRNEERVYLDLACGQKKLLNMKVTGIPIIIDALVTVPKGLIRRLKDLEIGRWATSIQITALLRLFGIPRRVPESWSDLLSLRL